MRRPDRYDELRVAHEAALATGVSVPNSNIGKSDPAAELRHQQRSLGRYDPLKHGQSPPGDGGPAPNSGVTDSLPPGLNATLGQATTSPTRADGLVGKDAPGPDDFDPALEERRQARTREFQRSRLEATANLHQADTPVIPPEEPKPLSDEGIAQRKAKFDGEVNVKLDKNWITPKEAFWLRFDFDQKVAREIRDDMDREQKGRDQEAARRSAPTLDSPTPASGDQRVSDPDLAKGGMGEARQEKLNRLLERHGFERENGRGPEAPTRGGGRGR